MRRWRSSFSKKNSSEDSRRSYAGRTKAPGPHDRWHTRWRSRKRNRRNGNRGTRHARNGAKSCNGIPIFGRRNTMMWTTVRGFTDCCSSITALTKTGKRAGRAVRFVRKEDQGMSDEKGPKDVAYYGHPPFVAPEIGEQPPVGAWIAKDAACRGGMTGAAEMS